MTAKTRHATVRADVAIKRTTGAVPGRDGSGRGAAC
jgi:hypothetical protein